MSESDHIPTQDEFRQALLKAPATQASIIRSYVNGLEAQVNELGAELQKMKDAETLRLQQEDRAERERQLGLRETFNRLDGYRATVEDRNKRGWTY